MLLKVLYWLAVLAISLALVVGLILFFESRDQSSVERSVRETPVMRPA
jgi:cytochrome b subunit of formate dehydrogenase